MSGGNMETPDILDLRFPERATAGLRGSRSCHELKWETQPRTDDAGNIPGRADFIFHKFTVIHFSSSTINYNKTKYWLRLKIEIECSRQVCAGQTDYSDPLISCRSKILFEYLSQKDGRD